MQRVWQRVQKVLQPQGPHDETHRGQELRLPDLWEKVCGQENSHAAHRETQLRLYL